MQDLCSLAVCAGYPAVYFCDCFVCRGSLLSLPPMGRCCRRLLVVYPIMILVVPVACTMCLSVGQLGFIDLGVVFEASELALCGRIL